MSKDNSPDDYYWGDESDSDLEEDNGRRGYDKHGQLRIARKGCTAHGSMGTYQDNLHVHTGNIRKTREEDPVREDITSWSKFMVKPKGNKREIIIKQWFFGLKPFRRADVPVKLTKDTEKKSPGQFGWPRRP